MTVDGEQDREPKGKKERTKRAINLHLSLLMTGLRDCLGSPILQLCREQLTFGFSPRPIDDADIIVGTFFVLKPDFELIVLFS